MDEIKFLKRDLNRVKMENEELLTEVERLKKNGGSDPKSVAEIQTLKTKFKEAEDVLASLRVDLNEKNSQITQLSQNLKDRTDQYQQLKTQLATSSNELKLKAKDIQQYKDECKKLQASEKHYKIFQEKEEGYQAEIRELEVKLQEERAIPKQNLEDEAKIKELSDNNKKLQALVTEKSDRVDLLNNELVLFRERYNSLLELKDLKGKSASDKLKKLIYVKEKEVYNSKQIEAALRLKLRETLEKMEKYKNIELFEGDETTEELKNRISELTNKVKEYTLKFTHKNSECMSLRKKLKEAGTFCLQIAEAQPVLKKVEENVDQKEKENE